MQQLTFDSLTQVIGYHEGHLTFKKCSGSPQTFLLEYFWWTHSD